MESLKVFKTITRTEKYGNFEKKHIPKWGKKKKPTSDNITT